MTAFYLFCIIIQVSCFFFSLVKFSADEQSWCFLTISSMKSMKCIENKNATLNVHLAPSREAYYHFIKTYSGRSEKPRKYFSCPVDYFAKLYLNVKDVKPRAVSTFFFLLL